MAKRKRERRSIRLQGHDYAGVGAYFITICSHRRRTIFSNIISDAVRLTLVGEILRDEWNRTAEIRSEVGLGEFVIMPNHFHAIIFLLHQQSSGSNVGVHGNAPLRRSPRSLGALVAQFKGAVTRRVRETYSNDAILVWQRNYYERVIRDDRELHRIRRYIRSNPGEWFEDEYFPSESG